MATNALDERKGNRNLWYHLVWLDKNMKNVGNQRKVKLLGEIDPEIKTFISPEECIDYIEGENDRKSTSSIVFIISGALSEQIIPKIQDYTCVFAIFIFCGNPTAYEHLKYQKLRAIHTDMDELTDDIEMVITKFNETTDFSIFLGQTSTKPASEDPLKAQCSIRNLKEDLASFLWFRQMHEFMLTLNNDDDVDARNEMIANCRERCQGKSKMLLSIDKFSNQLMDEDGKTAIQWYTASSFIHQCTNSVLRKENISQVYSYRYIIKLICQQLKGLHKDIIDEYKKRRKARLRVYRGQHLKSDQIELLKNNLGNLISLNGFVSTTKDINIALEFIQKYRHEDAEPVIFKIDLDMTNEHNVPFADVTNISVYKEEQEVLLSIGSIFCVKSVELDNIDGNLTLPVIRLSLAQDNQVNVTNYIKQTYANDVDSDDKAVLFGKLLFDMGECDAAIKYFNDALQRLSDHNNHLRPIYLNNIGVCYSEIGKKTDALRYYQRAIQFYEQTGNKRGLSACQHNIASIYHAQGDQEKALQWALEAFDARQSFKIEKASTLDLLGCIYLAKADFDAALNNFDDALKLRLKYLAKIDPNHPDIGVSHHNLGKVNSKMAQPAEAQRHFLKAEEIYRHNYPPSNSLVLEINKCLRKTQ